MGLKWLTNLGPEGSEDNKEWLIDCITGPPQATDECSVAELKTLEKMVGIYRPIPDSNEQSMTLKKD